MLQHARAPARLDEHGAIVLLEDQDRSLWNQGLIAEGLALVERHSVRGGPGRYQVQAAIAAMHAQAQRPQDTDWAEIDRLYAMLESIAAFTRGDAEPRGRRVRSCTGRRPRFI